MSDYVTLPDIKLRLPDLGPTYDPVLEDLITQATSDIERLTGQFFGPVTATRTYDGTGRATLFLGWGWPLVSVTTLKIRTGGEGTTQVTIPAGDFNLEPADRPTADAARWIELGAGITSGVRTFTAGKRTVEIAGVWGRTEVPFEIKSVCVEMVVQAFRQRGAAGTNQTVDNLDLDQILRGLTPRALRILADHGMGREVYVAS